MEPLKFNKSQLEHTIDINPEEHFLRVIKAEVKNFKKDQTYDFSISVETFSTLSDLASPDHITIGSTPNQDSGVFTLNRIMLSPETPERVKKITFSIEDSGIGEEELTLFYETRNLNVSIDDPLKEFKKHLDEKDNAKILFSAPFGHGKTTFIKEFFRLEDEGKGNYEVFHLFPVNYAVASNEDIFRFIKTEILFDLLGRNVELDQEKFSYWQTLPFFVKRNIAKLFTPFLTLIPKVGKDVNNIATQIISLFEKYKTEHQKLQLDEKKEAVEFLREVYEKEGSIFEDNFYSQLIRQLIQQLKEQGKQTVLIIDDTDRMDPEHIFRILNVFAAHFDSPEYREGDSNKFGFDNIIIVCDYNNLHKIFSHRYGATTDFAGYIDKFFSKEIFRYDNAKAITQFVKSITLEANVSLKRNIDLIFSDLIRTNAISLREIKKLRKDDMLLGMNFLEKTHSSQERNETFNRGFFAVLNLLRKIFDESALTYRIRSCQTKISDLDISSSRKNKYDSYARILLTEIALVNKYQISEDNLKPITLSLNQVNFYLHLKTEYDQIFSNLYFSCKKVTLETEDGEEKTFDIKEFYELFIVAISKFDELLNQRN